MAKITAVIASPRKGNCYSIVNKITETAKASGNEIECFVINELDAKGCQSCYGCKKKGSCVIKDGMKPVLDSFAACDGLIIATPTYWGHASAQYRLFEDRLFGFLKADFSTDVPTGKKLAVVVTCNSGVDGAEALRDNLKGIMTGVFKMDCVGDMVYSEMKGPAADDADAMAEAERIGKLF